MHSDLKNLNYQPLPYKSFFISDPKLRHIHKANIRDRVLHQAVFRILCPVFDKSFIYDSYSSRINKGTHKGVERLYVFLRKANKNFNKPAFVLKCDVAKFFGSINHEILISLIKRKIKDEKTIWLLEKIIRSFNSDIEIGLPLGNVTSQLFANIYLNELDQFIKHKLKIKYYARYTDDFVIVSDNRDYFQGILPNISYFLKNNLKLNLHPKKCFIKKFHQGIDFLGTIILPHHKIIRTKTKNRIFRNYKQRIIQVKEGKINKKKIFQILNSYLGVFSHANSFELKNELLELFPFSTIH